MTPEDLNRWHEADVRKRRAFLRERYQYLTAKIKEAEELGADAGIVKQLKVLLAFVVRDANLLDREETIRDLKPKAIVGEKFVAGRKSGTVGTVRGWIRKYMKKYPTAKPAQAWEAFTKRPPRGCTVSGSDIWTDGAGGTSRAWFGTMVGQERPKK